MNKCPLCGFHNPEDIHICLHCASAINQTCPQCGGSVPMGNRFCGLCGARLEEIDNPKPTETPIIPSKNNLEIKIDEIHASMPENLAARISQASTKLPGQRREVTVLFAHIANFNQVSTKLDSENFYLALDEIMHLFAGVIYKYEGVIDKITGPVCRV